MSNEARWLHETTSIVADINPVLDWERVEQRLLQRIDAEAVPRPVLVPEVPWRRLVALAAVAAAAAIGIHATSGSGPRTTQAPSSTTRSLVASALTGSLPYPSSALRAGDQLRADVPTSFEHEDWARFAMTAGSELTVDRISDHVELTLAKGSVDVSVTPGHQPASFVVVTGNTAIAVHGTRFSVIRKESNVIVRVDEGVVSVGAPSRNGPTVRWLVGARSQGTFSLDGARTASFATWRPRAPVAVTPPDVLAEAEPEADNQQDEPEAPPPVHHVEPSHTTTVAPPPVLPETLTLASAQPALSPLLSQIYACYRSAGSSTTPGVKVSVHSSLSMTIAPDGHVVFGRFDPPLKPDAQVCASGAVQTVRFPRTQGESKLRVELEF